MFYRRSLSGKPVYLVAATLRPETMYGQTNCWAHPDINYIAYNLKNDEVFISTERAARNMAYQGFFEEEGKIQVLLKLTGQVTSVKNTLKIYYNIFIYIVITYINRTS